MSKDCFQDSTWLVDSGASSHMTWNKELLAEYQEFETPEKVGLGDGHTVDALGIGNIHLRMLFKVSQSKKSVMYKVLYVPQLARNLFSVRAAASKGNLIKFGHTHCWIRDSDGKLNGMGTVVDNLIVMLFAVRKHQLQCHKYPRSMKLMFGTLDWGMQVSNILRIWPTRS